MIKLSLMVLMLQLPQPQPVLPKPQPIETVNTFSDVEPLKLEGRVTPDLKDATEDLLKWLESSVQDGNTIKRDAWIEYLKLEKLQNDIESKKVPIADVEKIKSLLEKDHSQLKLEPFQRFKQELEYWLKPSSQPIDPRTNRRGYRFFRSGSL